MLNFNGWMAVCRVRCIFHSKLKFLVIFKENLNILEFYGVLHTYGSVIEWVIVENMLQEEVH